MMGPRPKPERVLLVANPVARTVSRQVLDVIEKAMAADFKLDVDETRRRGHATELARSAVRDGYDMVVVFSGDGTVNEVVNGLAHSDVALGVLPGGATNVLARVLGMPADPVEATGWLLGAALRGRYRRIGLGHADGRYSQYAHLSVELVLAVLGASLGSIVGLTWSLNANKAWFPPSWLWARPRRWLAPVWGMARWPAWECCAMNWKNPSWIRCRRQD